MIAKCNLKGKPVVCATQMLESMHNAPRPTRAEAGDVANAVLDGADCVMLSGESANGDFPIEAVTVMRRIVEEAEQNLDYQALYLKTRENVLKAAGGEPMDSGESMASSAAKSASDIGAPLIICFTKSGGTVARISKYRPKAAILAVTGSEEVAKSLLWLRGVTSCIDKNMEDDTMNIAKRAIDHATKIGVQGMQKGAKVVVLSEEKANNSKQLKVLTI